MVTFSLQVRPDNAEELLTSARRAEAAGFDTLHCADHPGAIAAPFVALAAAAAVTSTIGLGPYVANTGIREPMPLAVDVASLDLISGGRARLGLGAGHNPAEWHALGRERPDVAGRVRRFTAVTRAVRELLDGAEVTVDTPELTVRAARLTAPRPVQERIPLTVGTSNSRLLRWAGRHADVVGLSGAGRTRPDGYQHDVRWREADIEAQLALVAEGAAGRSVPPAMEALVQLCAVTDDAEAATADFARDTGLTVDELLACPYVLIGTEDEILSAVRRHERRWGITRFVVRADALDQLTPLLPRL
ncbi:MULTISPECIES: LLM class flavin-dependent oxidoreductase [Micromonospora]|uniref:Probable F420-dependent oxidoreductase, MSMEG_2516 family n=1 Tax=Micromonospora yangpuensis TaxID=683228 RepID=A0A1C6V123_9ACTN|nr:LLM class flavin-dependent oxidoreductase [Micromonospora yangpuensis]GGL97336.1 LLM class F420-dependent oxidoreductase [Micromonospora yangpuensis]SCL59973.1 probable F420-dependent oxidoreductase, MSMEG_2516 family [Micromonospora yangpuensis]